MWLLSVMRFRRGVSYPLVVAVMLVTTDVENDHPDDPDQTNKQQPNEFLCHGCVSLQKKTASVSAYQQHIQQGACLI